MIKRIIGLMLVFTMTFAFSGCFFGPKTFEPYSVTEAKLGTTIETTLGEAYRMLCQIRTFSVYTIKAYFSTNQPDEEEYYCFASEPDSEGSLILASKRVTANPEDTKSPVYIETGEPFYLEDGVLGYMRNVQNEEFSNKHPITIDEFNAEVERINSTKFKVSGYYFEGNLWANRDEVNQIRKDSLGVGKLDVEVPEGSYVTVIGDVEYGSISLHNCVFVEGDE